ncbi:MAG: hypothetical protein ABMB14_18340 [Myxococcota bacterium]
MWGWFAVAARAATVEVQVPDPLVTTIELRCTDRTYTAEVRDGRASFEHVPDQCQVFLIRKSGTITATGKWTCTLDACRQDEVQHRPVTDAPNRINVIVTTALPPGAALELTCNDGFRIRSDVVTNTAVFESVPDQECTLFFKGTVPAKFRPIRAGTWSCALSGTTAICTRR